MTNKMRVVFSAFEYKTLEKVINKVLKMADELGVEYRGPIPLPTKIKRWTVNRSTFIYEQSKEQFEMRVHRRLIDFVDPNDKFVEELQNMQIPVGVNVKVKMVNEK